MPLYWRNRYFRRRRQHWRRRRRRPFTTWGIRRPFRRRYARRNRVRRKRRYFKKLKKIRLNQWQPKNIVKCIIRGDIPLFICGKTRISHNYTLYKESNTEAGEATGGGWSIQQFTLKTLYEEYIKYKNVWSKGNQGLPLVRYTGCQIKLYKNPFTAYIVTIKNCPPYTVTKDMFLNTQPQRMLMEKHKIIVPRLKSTSKKAYKKVKIRTPSLLQNKWYFQQDFCTQPLLNITASACSLEQPFAPENRVSDSITLISLETNTFQNSDFETVPDTEGYIPKHLGTKKMHLYGVNFSGGTEPPKKWKDVIYLGNTSTYFEGNGHYNKIGDLRSKNNWGNPFAFPWNHDDHPIYYSDRFPTTTENLETEVVFTPLENLYVQCRYNPQKDKGTGNLVYLKHNNHSEQSPIDTPPDNPRLQIRDFPLWLIFWGWIDWLKRVPEAQQIDSGYYFVVKSQYIYPPRNCYVFLDRYFTNTDGKDLTIRDKMKWHPKYEQQTEVEFYFAQTGPFAPKVNRSELIQANMFYKFYLKWGGCPAPMEHIVSPCDQEKYPVPNSELQTLQIQDPETSKFSYLYEWDERRGQITERCAKRIKKEQTPDFSLTDLSTLNPAIETQQKESDQETTSEEETETLELQLRQLRKQQRKLKHQLLRLTKKPLYE
nr:MAG: ORF1 [TTV-like mini virus]